MFGQSTAASPSMPTPPPDPREQLVAYQASVARAKRENQIERTQGLIKIGRYSVQQAVKEFFHLYPDALPDALPAVQTLIDLQEEYGSATVAIAVQKVALEQGL